MSNNERMTILTAMNRRDFLRTGTGLTIAASFPRIGFAEGSRTVAYDLTVGKAKSLIVGERYPETEVWAYNQAIPGPELRVRQGDRLRVTVQNALDQDTTVHWHGIRLPNAMDGVPHVTQPPISPGETYTYEFVPPDAGSFWYHPHINSSEQTGRGLHGTLIVDEPDAPDFDRELVWVLDDWRFDKTAAIQSFGRGHDSSHGGRIGNVVTVNGRLPQGLPVQAGERLRLRLLNVANARHFALRFEDHEPQIIAIDGQPVTPHQPDGGQVVLAPAMRIDLLLDMTGRPGDTTRVVDTFYRDAYLLDEINYRDEAPLRSSPGLPIQLPPNPLPEPNLKKAERHEIVFAGGAMGGLPGAKVNGSWKDIRTMARSGVVWAINGVAASGRILEPLLTLRRNQSYIFAMRNDTVFPHPIHLHGHHYRVISRGDQPTRFQEWQDTVLMQPRERVEVAFVADNPGDWMFHCHIPEHMEAGMMGVVRVA